jgi:hypothetical protein
LRNGCLVTSGNAFCCLGVRACRCAPPCNLESFCKTGM